jgi:hypothetical protein
MVAILPVLSGCVVVDFFENVESVIEGPQEYAWQTMTIEERFGWFDMVNEELSKVVEYPIYVRNGTRFLNLYVQVTFSNPLSPDLTFLSQGNLNMTVAPPSGDEITETYCTTTKYRTFEWHNNFETSGSTEEWSIALRMVGYGNYKIVAKTYEPV